MISNLKYLQIIVIFIIINLLVILVETKCPNSCSGHGSCGMGNTCVCYDGWNGGAADCSMRTCPNGTAWVDKAYDTDYAHQKSECSNAGICDRKTGICNCFTGFTGIACQRNSCPKDCSGHGICSTIGDASYFSGPDYNPQYFHRGDGYGPVYKNWDSQSIQMCECDDGFFGPDCSRLMCPKGDDPMTINQVYRKIQFDIKSKRFIPTGQIGIEFQGKKVYIDIDTIDSTSSCADTFTNKGKFGTVTCVYNKLDRLLRRFTLEFKSWPTYPKDNNLYANDGNPSINEFFCDFTYSVGGATCIFSDIVSTNIVEYTYCSNKGTCDFSSGTCTCQDGWGGVACGDPINLYTSYSSGIPGHLVNVEATNFVSSVLQLNTVKSSASDFRFIEGIANSETVFYVRGDGMLSASQLEILSGGQTIAGGGLIIQDGGATILNGGLNVYSSSKTTPALSVISKYSGFLGSSYNAIELSTHGSDSNNHYLLHAKNQGNTKFSIRGDGAVFIRSGGLLVTSGVSIYSGGLGVTGGLTVNNYGLIVSSSGIKVTGGATINGGLRISGGLQVTGGQTVYAGGIRVVGGVYISSSGLVVTGGTSIKNNGMSVTGGATIYTGGLSASGGATITGGLNVLSGGMTVKGGVYGGLTILSSNLYVTTGGLTLTGGGGAYIDSGLTVNSGGAIVSGGLSVYTAGLYASGGLTVRTGAYITGGLTVADSGAVITGGATVTGTLIASNGLQVNSGATISSSFSVSGSSTLAGATVTGNFYVSGTSTFNGAAYFNNGVSISGYLTLQNTPVYTSDRRLKTNISPIKGALKKVNQLQGIYFDWIQKDPAKVDLDKDRHVGLIAQDIQRVLPEALGKTSPYLSVDYPAVIPLLVEAIRDLAEIVEDNSSSDNHVNVEPVESSPSNCKQELDEVQTQINDLLNQKNQMLQMLEALKAELSTIHKN